MGNVTVDKAGNLVRGAAESYLLQGSPPPVYKMVATGQDLVRIVPSVLKGEEAGLLPASEIFTIGMSPEGTGLGQAAGQAIGTTLGTTIASTGALGVSGVSSGAGMLGLSAANAAIAGIGAVFGACLMVVGNIVEGLLGTGEKAVEAEKRYLGRKAERIVDLGRARAWASRGLVAPERPRHEGEILGATFEQFEKLEPFLSKDLQTEWYKIQLPGVIEQATTGEGPILSSQGPDDLINYAKSFEATRRTYTEPQGI
jgi:hypothetical protein